MSLTQRSLTESIRWVGATLRDGRVAEWSVESEVLLRHVLGVDRAEFFALAFGRDDHLTDCQLKELTSIVRRRISGEPLAYITGQREFYGLELDVADDVLIPRQETELIVDIALERLAQSGDRIPLVVDVGTGSGGIALAIAAHANRVHMIATDISKGALDVAVRNALKLGLSDRIEFLLADMLAPISRPADIIVSNPPYIPSSEIDGLSVEVLREPRTALDGGVDGLDPLRKLLVQADAQLASGGALIVELMPEQMQAAMSLADQTIGGEFDMSIRTDLMGNERAVVINRVAANDSDTCDGDHR